MTKSGQLSVASHILVPDLTNSSVKYKIVGDHTIQLHPKKGVLAIQCKNKQTAVSTFEEAFKNLTTVADASLTNGGRESMESIGSSNSLDMSLESPLKIDGPYKSPVSVSRKPSLVKQSTLRRGPTLERYDSDSATITLKMVMNKLEIIDAKLDELLGSSGNRGRKNN